MTDDKDKQWTVLESEYLIRRPWLTARRDRVRLPNGVENNEYYVLEYPDWVNVIGVWRRLITRTAVSATCISSSRLTAA